MNPSDPLARLCDLMKQGFMKPRKARKPPKSERPIITCDDCLNWHRQGKHTANKAQRAINRAANLARVRR